MSDAEIHVGDVGTQFSIIVVDEDGQVIDISSATTLNLIFQKPDTTEITKTGVLTTDGTDGKFYYTSQTGFLNLAGIWRIQAQVIYSGSQWYSNIGKFQVKPNL